VSVVFLDSVGLLALWNRSDQWHPAADRAFAQVTKNQDALVTTTFVLAESGNAAARRPFRNDAVQLRESFEAAKALIWPTEEDWRLAWNAYQRGEADAAGIVDHLSFAVMRRLDITQAFTTDRHFRAAGFEVLIRRLSCERLPPAACQQNHC
jgi:predicted nucleic acid-binding protein